MAMKCQYTDEELLDHIRSMAVRMGRPPSLREMDRDLLAPSAFTYKRRFPSWTHAVRLALGEETPVARAREKADNHKMVVDLRRLAARLGRAPSVNELNAEPGTYHANTYIRHYGTWLNAIEEILGIPQ